MTVGDDPATDLRWCGLWTRPSATGPSSPPSSSVPLRPAVLLAGATMSGDLVLLPVTARAELRGPGPPEYLGITVSVALLPLVGTMVVVPAVGDGRAVALRSPPPARHGASSSSWCGRPDHRAVQRRALDLGDLCCRPCRTPPTRSPASQARSRGPLPSRCSRRRWGCVATVGRLASRRPIFGLFVRTFGRWWSPASWPWSPGGRTTVRSWWPSSSAQRWPWAHRAHPGRVPRSASSPLLPVGDRVVHVGALAGGHGLLGAGALRDRLPRGPATAAWQAVAVLVLLLALLPTAVAASVDRQPGERRQVESALIDQISGRLDQSLA